MFKLQDDPRYWWPVKVQQPHPEDAEQTVETSFEAEFKWLDDDAHDDYVKKAGEQRLDDRQAVPEVFTGFRKVFDDNDVEVPCTPDTMRRLLAQPGVATCIARTYFVSRREVVLKNLQGLLGRGPGAAPTQS